MHVVVDGRCIHKNMGGIGYMTQHLLASMARSTQGHRLSLLIGSGSQAPAIPGIDVYEVQGHMIDERFEQLYLPDILGELAADVYLNPTFSVPAIKTTAAQIAIIHDVVFEDHPAWVEPRLRHYLQKASRFTAAHADHIITVSEYSRERICAVYGVAPDKVTRIYNGLPTESLVPPSTKDVAAARTHYGLTRPFVLFLSTVEVKKGITELIQAFSRLLQQHSELDLVVAGGTGGPELDLNALITDAGCSPQRIKRLGYIDEQHKKPLLSACELLVYPSRYEGFGLTPLEGLALGKTCVVHDGTSLPEVVGAEAIRVDVTDTAAFTEALHAGLTDEKFRSRVKRSGPARVRAEFSWDRLARRYWDVCTAQLVGV